MISSHLSWSPFEVGSVVRQEIKLPCVVSIWPMGKPHLCPRELWRCRLLPAQPSLLALPSCAVLSSQLCLTLCDPIDCSPPGSSVLGDSPGKNTGVSCHAFLQGIFLTQGSNPCLLCLLHCRQLLYHLATGEASSVFLLAFICSILLSPRKQYPKKI